MTLKIQFCLCLCCWLSWIKLFLLLKKVLKGATKMPLPQTLHRISTKVKKILKSNKHYRLRVLDSQHPRNPCTDILEKQATIYKSKEKEKFIRQIHHNIWRPLKLKTQSASGMQLITTTIFFLLGSLSWKILITQICLLFL